jgi:mono/diheme cytochrome c family protein
MVFNWLENSKQALSTKESLLKPNARGLLLFFFLAVGTSAGAAEKDAGKQLYMQYCSSCHGIDGRGNGPVSPYLKIKVPDLTLLKKNNKGLYPMGKVMSAIADPEKYTELTSLLKIKVIGEYRCDTAAITDDFQIR